MLKISEDGESTLTAYLPTKPSGRAVVCLPGGGYTHLAIDNLKGHLTELIFLIVKESLFLC